MLTTLPFVIGVAAVKAVAHYAFGFEGVLEFSDLAVVLTAGVFLTGFLLTGTMSDFKESEKLPGELACTLETIEEQLVQGVATKPALPVEAVRKDVLVLTDAVLDWLHRRIAHEACFAALSAFHGRLVDLEKSGVGIASRVTAELHNLRKTVTRVSVISRTGFLPPAYALLETLLVIIVILLLAARYKTALAELILVPFITLLYVYMLRLIRDIDDPFEYSPDGVQQGAAEVELFPLKEFRARLAARLPGASASSPATREATHAS
jgi:hypothetical protein